MENCPKTLFFLGNSMTIKFGTFANFIVRNFVVIWEAPNLATLINPIPPPTKSLETTPTGPTPNKNRNGPFGAGRT